MNYLDYTELDPGIRGVVERLRRAGFETTDSGDGKSKPEDWYESGEALRFPHVAAATDPETMIADAERMALVLGGEWVIEASYSTADKSAILFARQAVEGELNHGSTT